MIIGQQVAPQTNNNSYGITPCLVSMSLPLAIVDNHVIFGSAGDAVVMLKQAQVPSGEHEVLEELLDRESQ